VRAKFILIWRRNKRAKVRTYGGDSGLVRGGAPGAGQVGPHPGGAETMTNLRC
jgi:hypothetical protein